MTENNAIRNDPEIKKLLSRLPNKTALSLTDIQLCHLKKALYKSEYQKHKIDFRGTFPIPFNKTKIYFVLLMGRDLRAVTRQEKTIAVITTLFLSFMFLVITILIALIALYLIKSALGINLFEGFSTGLWNWLKEL